jgi:drug/metabolite transporter (DMT)-like permease
MLLLVLFGIFNGMAHLMFARAFALAPVSVLAPFEYSPLLIGGVIGFLIWAEVPGWTTLAGASLVVAAGLYNVYREQVRRAAERAGAFSNQAKSLGDSENATKNNMKENA